MKVRISIYVISLGVLDPVRLCIAPSTPRYYPQEADHSGTIGWPFDTIPNEVGDHSGTDRFEGVFGVDFAYGGIFSRDCPKSERSPSDLLQANSIEGS